MLPRVDDARAAARVVSITDLAHGLGLLMVAEGVENIRLHRAGAAGL